MRSGGFECVIGKGGASSTEMTTGVPHDFRIVEFKPPTRVFKVFKT